MSAKKPEILALIPARGGSKGIPRKNLLMVGGKPLIAYSILQALGSKWITRTIVSTDSAEIAQASLDWGAEVPFMRPSEFAQDQSLDLDVFRHVLRTLKEKENYEPTLVVHLRPTSPARRVSIIDSAIEMTLAAPQADSLRAVSPPAQNPFKMWRQNSEGFLEPLLNLPGVKESYNQPRQALPAVLWQNGYLDIYRPQVILSGETLCGDKILPLLIEGPAIDLDSPEDIPQLEDTLRQLDIG